MKLIMNTIIRSGVFLCFIILSAMIVSCNKSNQDTADKNQNPDTVKLSGEDFNESDEDLLTVDYKQFYDELAPKGEWIEVTDNDLGMKLKSSASNDKGHRKITLSELFGVSDAYADDLSFGSFFVWKPAPDLSIGVTAGEPQIGYQPYTNGEWVYTNAGWYFKAPTPQEEITHHYGRWVNSPSLGWTWVPGRVWAPAWVDWRENDTYIAWAPIPFGINIENSIIVAPPLVEDRYVVVEQKNFIQPGVYKYMYKENKNKIMIKEWRRIDGVMVMNKTVINKGPNVTVIRTVTGQPVNEIKIIKVKTIQNVKYTSTEYDVYSPEFVKVKTKGKTGKPFSKPNVFVSYENAKVKYESSSTQGKDKNEKGSENSDKEKEKIEKEKKEKEQKEKGKDKEKEKGNEKEKEKGNDKEKEKGNDKEKEKGNDKEKEKGKDKEKGNDKEKGKDKGGKK
jgi:hypothetical protein